MKRGFPFVIFGGYLASAAVLLMALYRRQNLAVAIVIVTLGVASVTRAALSALVRPLHFQRSCTLTGRREYPCQLWLRSLKSQEFVTQTEYEDDFEARTAKTRPVNNSAGVQGMPIGNRS